MTTLYTIGHSNHSLRRWLELLAEHGIGCVVDVRSVPYSRFSPHFGKRELEPAMRAAGLRYAWEGRDLGGIPDDEADYDDAGHVLYERLAARPEFEEALDRVVAAAAGGSTKLALMCGEEDPEHCHRRLLVSRALMRRGCRVVHLRADGTSREEGDLERAADLFADPLPWRSRRPVRRRDG